MLSFSLSFQKICFFLLAGVTRTQATLPWSSSAPSATLTKKDDQVAFDPLGVAAVLYNPRADKSAARLYTQYDRGLFTWPHMTMIGGTLPPMQMLMESLTATLSGIHPAIKMCAKDTTMIPVRSDISGNVFRQLPVNLSNLWLGEAISFPTSRYPGNDFAVIYVDAMHEDIKKRKDQVRKSLGTVWWWTYNLLLDLIGLVNGAMLMTGMVCSLLLADIWAFMLFFLYGFHWLSSVFVSLTSMVKIHKPKIREDSTIRYAVYEREEGGTVVFKGPQDILEEWARSTWEYDQKWTKDSLHWLWVVSGTLSGIASVACMVNMRSFMQLAFLAVLVYSSIAEVVATRIARGLQGIAHGTINMATVVGNESRSQAIIRLTLEIDPSCRLTGLNWVQLGLLPDMPVFQRMQALLFQISEIQKAEQAEIEKKTESKDAQIQVLERVLGNSPIDEEQEVASRDWRNSALEKMFAEFENHAVGYPRRLARRIVSEMKDALKMPPLPSDVDD
ncbi:hypothetical protein N7474_001001 [Penicillium riverlandense]|uniref:uncharacterized protein n=1 Tax=Penicillium riverlandense TaxID=1903569 RepID=UPI002548D35D|nr:uncharacterized protein N7474_001001 [Penicillium riverlandense]KAJ5832690.1 hypothetical protein N7474_001001 [Penicillium riverlandense]